MARLERGKGKRQQTIEVTRSGSVLRMQEDAGGDLRLPGYRTCASEDAAQAALVAEVRRHLTDGMRAGDPAAQAIADTTPTGPDAAPPTFPIRRDLGVYNEATGFVCTSRRMAGKAMDEGSEAWLKAAARGDLLPMSLVQDDPFVIRVVAGAPLDEQEREEWVGRVDWHLNIPDGRLCVTGGAVFSSEDYDDDEPYHEGFVAELAVPKGRYRATLYTHAYGVNGGAVLDEVAGGRYDSHEPIPEWWARTRGAEPMPALDENEDVVAFLLHLEPVEKAPAKRELSTLPEAGWFGGAENARKPERCPRGIVGVDVARREPTDSGAWMFVRDVTDMIGPRALAPLRGGPVVVPLAELPFVARLAWFASRWVAYEMRCTIPVGTSIGAIAWPAEVIGVEEEEGVVRVLMSSDVEPHLLFARLGEMARVVGALPPGTTLELLSAPTGSMRGEPGAEGRMRLQGAVRDGTWTVSAAYPAADAATLGAAIALAREASTGNAIACSEAREVQAVMERVRAMFGPHLREDPPQADGATIRNKSGGHDLLLTASAVFALRFGKTWPVAPFESFDEDDDEEDATPIVGAHVWTAPGGRAYHQTMAMLLSDDLAQAIGLAERTFRAERWQHVGDLVCEDVPAAAWRGYTSDGGSGWGVMRCEAPADVQLLVASRFSDGTLLLTSPDGNARDDPDGRILRTGVAGANTRGLYDAHAKRLSELEAAHGAPMPTTRHLEKFAEWLESLLEVNA